MSKLRVHDMAGEFGIPSEEVITLLRSMDVPVRSHLSVLSDDQVARVRARWEREKRARAEKPAAASTGRRRRGAAAAEPTPAVASQPAGPVADGAGAVRRRRRRASEPVTGEHEGDDVQVEEGATAAASPQAVPAQSAEAQPVDAAAAAPPATPPAATDVPATATIATPAADAVPVVDAQKVEPTAAPAAAEPPRAPVSARPPSARPAEREVRKPAIPASDRAAAAEAASAAETAPRTTEKPSAPAVPPAAPTPTPAPSAPAATAPTPPPAPPSTPAESPPAQMTPASAGMRPAASATPLRPSEQARPSAAGPRPAPAAGAPRPRPVGQGAPRPRPVAGSSGPVPPRSAAGGAGRPAPRADATSAAAKGRRKKGRRGSVDQEAVSQNITKTMSAMRGGSGGRRGRRSYDDGGAREEQEAQRVAAVEREKKTVHVNEFITVSELATILKIPATQIVAFAFKNLGLMVTINQRLDFDQIELIAGEFGFQAVLEAEYAVETTAQEEADLPEELQPRPPVVTIMGHVDHGKTSLLDYIRKATVVAGESGGITQHIGAYHVALPDDRRITFLDTPGHEAFTAMRARGAQVTDVVVLVVAADDQVMPQTVEAISHARNAGVPMVVAINKVDLPSANPGKVKQDLLQHSVVVEEFGGDVMAQEISAKTGAGVPELLEKILLQADLLELQANPDRRATGAVVEAQLDPGKGPVATVLVQNGTIKVSDDFICGIFSGRVRALLDERGKQVKSAGPAIPVQVLGLTGVPMAGDQFVVVEDASEAREIAHRRERLEREARSRRSSKGIVTLEDFMSQTDAGEKRQLKLLIKADQGGPAEALADALQQLSNEEVQVEVIQRAVGAITESDILLAKASGAVILGFHVRPDNKARAAAEREGVDIKLYRIIYEAVADVRSALEGLLRPEEREVIVGEALVREAFKVPKIGLVAGCIIRSGVATRAGKVRVIRDGVEVYDGHVGSLRRFKDDVREVREGFECGIGIENFNDVKVGDVFEFYRTEEVARTLESSSASHS